MFKNITAAGSIFVLGTFATLSLAITPATAGSLKAAEIDRLFPGIYEAHVKGHSVTITARANGTMKGSALLASDTGRWWRKGNALCVAFTNWGDGRTLCGRLRRAGAWYQAVSAGKVALSFRPYRRTLAVNLQGN